MFQLYRMGQNRVILWSEWYASIKFVNLHGKIHLNPSI